MRFEQPYQEQLFRIGKELGRRLHEQGINWWDKQLDEYEPLPHWHDLNALWEVALAKHFSVRIADYPFWLDHRAQHAVLLGRQCRHPADQGSGG